MCCLCAQLRSPFVTPAIFQGTSRWHLSKLPHLGSPYSWWHIPTSVASHCCWMENADGSIALTFPHFLFFLSANHAKFYQKNPSGLNNRDIKEIFFWSRNFYKYNLYNVYYFNLRKFLQYSRKIMFLFTNFSILLD